MGKAKSKSICFSEEVSDVPAEEVAGYMWSISRRRSCGIYVVHLVRVCDL